MIRADDLFAVVFLLQTLPACYWLAVLDDRWVVVECLN